MCCCAYGPGSDSVRLPWGHWAAARAPLGVYWGEVAASHSCPGYADRMLMAGSWLPHPMALPCVTPLCESPQCGWELGHGCNPQTMAKVQCMQVIPCVIAGVNACALHVQGRQLHCVLSARNDMHVYGHMCTPICDYKVQLRAHDYIVIIGT